MKIAFIFVIYKTQNTEIERLKKEVKRLCFKDFELYFIDNTEINLGYAGAANIGIKKGLQEGCEIFAICNPDISFVGHDFNEDILTRAAKYFDIWGYAMNQDGKIYYGGKIDKWRMSGGLISKKPKKRFSEVDFLSGSFIFIKKKVIDKIGLLDESYFLYYEDVDYCYRAKIAGFRVGIDSELKYDHFEISKSNPIKENFLFKNRLRFLLKHGVWRQKLRELIRTPKTIFEEIMKRPFYINFFSLNFSSLVNKILHFVLFLTLIKYFNPEDYAIYTLAWTHIGLLLPVLDFGTTSYGLVNLTYQDKKQVSVLFSFRIALSLITFASTIGLAYIFGYGKDILYPIILTSFVIFANTMSGTFLILVSIANKSYLVSLVTLVFQIILVISLIIGIVITKKLMTVFWLTFILYNIYSVINFWLIKKQIGPLKFYFDMRSWLKIAKKSVIFLVISLLASFYSKMDVLILNYLKGKTAVGIYSSGYRFLDALMFIVSAYNVSSMSIFSGFARSKNKEFFLRKIKRDLGLVLAIGGTVAVGIYIFSPHILPLFLKGDYAMAIAPLRIIIFSLPLILLTSIALNGLYSLNKAKWVVGLFFFQLVYNFIGNYLFIPKYSYFASSYVSVTGEIINALVSFIILKKAINESFS